MMQAGTGTSHWKDMRTTPSWFPAQAGSEGMTAGTGSGMLRLAGAGAVALAGSRAFAADKLKVAAVFGTPIEEPWVNQIHVALLKAKDELGIDYQWSESVKASDFARVLREYAEKGANLIMGDAFTDEQAARRVAKQYPKVAFVMGSGIGPADPNFSVFDNWIHEPAYISGMIAGKLTKTNAVGVVAAMPIPEVNRLANAFCAGAKEVNDKAKCKFSFIGSFFDPPKAKEAAQKAVGLDESLQVRDLNQPIAPRLQCGQLTVEY